MIKRISKLILTYAVLLSNGCADQNFLDSSAINSSILNGEKIKETDEFYGRPVMIAQNYEYTKSDQETKARPLIFGICSGVVLNPTTVLTAAHCVKNISKSRVILTTNMYKKISDESHVYKIHQAIVHPKYTELKQFELESNTTSPHADSNYFDIALLTLDRPINGAIFDFSYFMKMSSFEYFKLDQNQSESKNGSIKTIATGYGRKTSLENPESEEVIYSKKTGKPKAQRVTGILKKAHINIPLTELKNKIITIDQVDKPGACNGDSGGPLFTIRRNQPYLQGIAIAVYKNPTDDPNNTHNACRSKSMFLNLDYFKVWILDSIRSIK